MNIKCVLIPMIFLGSIMSFAEDASPIFLMLRQRLDKASKVTLDENYSSGQNAYIKLMAMGESGYKVLSEAWAYDNIPEENWIQWDDDLMTRFGNEEKEQIRQYTNYFTGRIRRESEYAQAVAKRMASTQLYTDNYLVDCMEGEDSVKRLIGYISLKQRHPNIAYFDADASRELRAQQISEITKNLNLVKGK